MSVLALTAEQKRSCGTTSFNQRKEAGADAHLLISLNGFYNVLLRRRTPRLRRDAQHGVVSDLQGVVRF